MANYTIRLVNIIDSINTTKSYGMAEGFLFKYNNQTFMISVHHFKPIINTLIGTTDKKPLRSHKTVLWNELQIFNCPEEKYVLNTKVIKTYRIRFNDTRTNVNMYINSKKATFASKGYEVLYHTPIQKSLYNKILLEETCDQISIQKYKGLSGSPVFDDEEHLIGVFSKIKIHENKLYGYVLPSIYLIKSLEKTDNENLYYLHIENYNNLKIGKYEISLDTDENPYIYYPPIKTKIPLEIFFSLEGDVDKNIICKNIKTTQLKKLDFQKYDNFDISQKIIKKEETFKLNTGLLTYLVSNGMDSEYQKILNDYISTSNLINDIWLKFDTNTTISMKC